MQPISRFLYFENSTGRIWEAPEGFLRLENRPVPRERVQLWALLAHLGQALPRRQWQKILADQRLMTPFTAGEQQWMATEWLPGAVLKNGYRYGAVLVAQNVFARLAMTQLVMATRGLPHTYRTFETEGEAVGWLLEMQGA